MPEAQSTLKKVQALQLAMLKECLRICEKHGIRYFLLNGSALGAVRHSGFIPWDDDIDIGMPRPDYDRFLSVAQGELGTDLFLQTYQTDPAYPLMFAKIRDRRTAFIESNLSHLDMNHGVFIDIFPLDGYPVGTPLAGFIRMAVNVCLAATLRKCNIKIRPSMMTLRGAIIYFIVMVLSALVPLDRLRQLLDHLTRIYEYNKSEVIISWYGAWGIKEAMPRDYLAAGRAATFEGLTVSIPSNYDGYLTSLYGDYMTPPPIEKRISHHFTDVIDVDNSYATHLGHAG